ncbi:MAG: two-component regulator propeller domain-containing protein [Anaeromyxobacteraceae bacterium]
MRHAVVLACALAWAGCGGDARRPSGGVPDGGGTPGGTDPGPGIPPEVDGGTPAPPPTTLKAPLSVDGWTFYGAEQGLPVEVYDVSADEGGNVYVAGGDGVYAKRPAATVAPADDVFARFDAASAGITKNCYQGLDPWDKSNKAALDLFTHPAPPGPAVMCPVISVAGAAPGKVIIGFEGYGTDGDYEADWATDSSGLDVLQLDPAALKMSRTRHVLVASPPGVVCGTFEGQGSARGCVPGEYFMTNGRRKLRNVSRIVVNHDKAARQYGDVWMAGTHVALSAFFNDQAEARGWGGNAAIADCPNVPFVDVKACPKFAESRNVWEHEHPAFNSTTYANNPGVLIGPGLTGETYALALAPSGQPWSHNGLRLATMNGDTADVSNPFMPWDRVFDLWPDGPTAPDMDNVQAMTFCPDGALWVGSFSHGLARVNTTNGGVSGQSLPGGGQNVWALACDRNGVLWISTDWAEIVRLDTRTGVATMPLAARAGLPDVANRVAWNIQIDEWSGPEPIVYFAMHSRTDTQGVLQPGGVVAYSGK